mmetsp:Transcript_3689/g.9243  ORF Transcript_3689/g.9243 Transcript_3689/m.9243 type:complete len:326 (-) Transcript_3689:179-1156(-)
MSNDNDNNNVITIAHAASGSTAQVHLFGATVTSFITTTDGTSHQKKEHLFLSRHAKLDGSKAIRGGIPLVFPIFGPPAGKDDTMPQHGFARTNYWKHLTTTDTSNDMFATGTFELVYSRDVRPATVGTGNAWARGEHDVRLVYTVRVAATELTTTLEVHNSGETSFDFNCLLHTYLRVDDSTTTEIHGLGGYSIHDKIVPTHTGTVQSYDDNVQLAGRNVDAVFTHPEAHPTLHAQIVVSKSQTKEPPILRLEAAGQVNDQVSSVSAVVWNPAAEKAAAMSDFGTDEWKSMVCVEPGLLGHQPLLKPGGTARLSQSLVTTTALSE